MNIFILDHEIETCAQYHCDQHVSKMTLESVQILCTALHNRGIPAPYRPTHTKHPCVLWAGHSHDNFQWLCALTTELNREYRYRFGKREDHASMKVMRQIEHQAFESRGLTEFAQAMPDRYKKPGDVVTAYRRFYRGEKLSFARWTRRSCPDWCLPDAA